ncbi:hypothetical protein LJC59_09340 [Desulfovibrio sp. OttesenSCG-928-A18]|nr:hypothetical protein [Desulfovibrio sp. OttesenSCG-928-A18]
MRFVPTLALKTALPFRRFLLGLATAFVLLALAAPVPAANYNANDESRLNTAATVNDSANVLNWNPSPADTSSWNGVSWTTVGAEDRVKTISVDGTRLTGSLDLSGMTSLQSLSADQNALTGLNLTGDTALESLNVGFNNLGSLDLSANTALTELYVYYNNLGSLDLSANTALTVLSAYYNNLGSLNLSANTALVSLAVYTTISAAWT